MKLEVKKADRIYHKGHHEHEEREEEQEAGVLGLENPVPLVAERFRGSSAISASPR